jgi:hypothetical protein
VIEAILSWWNSLRTDTADDTSANLFKKSANLSDEERQAFVGPMLRAGGSSAPADGATELGAHAARVSGPLLQPIAVLRACNGVGPPAQASPGAKGPHPCVEQAAPGQTLADVAAAGSTVSGTHSPSFPRAAVFEPGT